MRMPLRLAARAVALLSPVFLVLAVAAPASAAPPVSWPDGDRLSTLETLALLVGAPLALLVLITLLVMAPSVAKGTNRETHVPWYAEPLQFGTAPGDDPGTAETTGTTGGGASVRW